MHARLIVQIFDVHYNGVSQISKPTEECIQQNIIKTQNEV